MKLLFETWMYLPSSFDRVAFVIFIGAETQQNERPAFCCPQRQGICQNPSVLL